MSRGLPTLYRSLNITELHRNWETYYTFAQLRDAKGINHSPPSTIPGEICMLM
uniref:Uncharacterized protein n=1 Tax=Daphnia galeata TaxID=27404 RepID=A0A8J2S071_9CRUS|nr:unnamed protein product [Daphnia galeata]